MEPALVGVHVEVKEPTAPADEQPDGEAGDQDADARLGTALDRIGQVGLEEHDREAEGEQAEGVAQAPREAEPRGRAGGPLPGTGDQGRDGGEVVGVGRVAQPEHDRDYRYHAQRGAVGEGCDPVVESEHGQLTFGTARTVIARPAARMTRALAAGKSRTSGPSRLTRRKAPRARTAAQPIAVIVNARPALNATISKSPKATRCSEIAASRTTSADGQGSSPPETPTASSERKLASGSAWWW